MIFKEPPRPRRWRTAREQRPEGWPSSPCHRVKESERAVDQAAGLVRGLRLRRTQILCPRRTAVISCVVIPRYNEPCMTLARAAAMDQSIVARGVIDPGLLGAWLEVGPVTGTPR
jgi:hypothetical protein